MHTVTRRRISAVFWISLIGYGMLVAGVVAMMVSIRASTLAEAEDEQSRVDWQKWKAAASAQDGTRSAVQRSAPKTDEPPLHLLMRDHFAATLFGLLVPLTALYWFIVWLVRGVMQSPGPAI